MRWLMGCWLMIFPLFGLAQTEAPLQETRAVWLTTVGGSDWPRTLNISQQQSDLRAIMRRCKDMKLNTVFMQIIARGDALFPSQRLPWAPWLTGTLNTDPGYDPLALAIAEAHANGLEFHAWVNVFFAGDNTSAINNQSEPRHVSLAHPEWMGNSTWLNPVFPEVREWLVGNVMEIVENYEVDGIHFDFARYPDQNGFENDAQNFLFFNPDNIEDVADWRRNNVTLFMRDAAAAIYAVKPWVKIGSTPFGNYKPFEGAWPAAWGFTDRFQEARRWLQAGYNDYLAPQIYWTIGREPEGSNTFDSPDFEYLVNDWMGESFDRHIYPGIAAYRSSVFAEIPQQIDVTRTMQAQGQTYFRYNHINTSTPPFQSKYPTRALPAPMYFRFEASAPTAPQGLTASANTAGDVTLTWAPASGSNFDPLWGYAVFRRAAQAPNLNAPEDLLTLLPKTANQFTDTFSETTNETYHYQVIALSQLSIPSTGSNVASATVTVAGEHPEIPTQPTITRLFPNPFSQQATLEYILPEGTSVTVKLYDLLGRDLQTLVDAHQPAGTYQYRIAAQDLPAGVYVCILRTAHRYVTKKLVVLR